MSFTLKKLISLTSLLCIISSCRFSPPPPSQQVVNESIGGEIDNDELKVIDSTKTEVTIDPSKDTKLSLDDSKGAISGAEISIPSGAIGVGTLSIAESIPIATSATTAALGLSEGNTISAASAALVITPSENKDPVVPLTLSLPLSGTSSLRLAEEALDPKTIVIYISTIYATQKTIMGIIPYSELIYKDGKVSFTTPYFGSFQVALSKEVISAPIKQETTIKPISKAEAAIIHEQKPVKVSLKSYTFSPTSKTIRLEASVENGKAISCAFLGDSDKKAPFDHIMKTKGSVIEFSVNTSKGGEYYIKAECVIDASGLIEASEWGEKTLVIPQTEDPNPSPPPPPSRQVMGGVVNNLNNFTFMVKEDMVSLISSCSMEVVDPNTKIRVAGTPYVSLSEKGMMAASIDLSASSHANKQYSAHIHCNFHDGVKSSPFVTTILVKTSSQVDRFVSGQIFNNNNIFSFRPSIETKSLINHCRMIAEETSSKAIMLETPYSLIYPADEYLSRNLDLSPAIYHNKSFNIIVDCTYKDEIKANPLISNVFISNGTSVTPLQVTSWLNSSNDIETRYHIAQDRHIYTTIDPVFKVAYYASAGSLNFSSIASISCNKINTPMTANDCHIDLASARQKAANGEPLFEKTLTHQMLNGDVYALNITFNDGSSYIKNLELNSIKFENFPMYEFKTCSRLIDADIEMFDQDSPSYLANNAVYCLLPKASNPSSYAKINVGANGVLPSNFTIITAGAYNPYAKGEVIINNDVLSPISYLSTGSLGTTSFINVNIRVISSNPSVEKIFTINNDFNMIDSYFYDDQSTRSRISFELNSKKVLVKKSSFFQLGQAFSIRGKPDSFYQMLNNKVVSDIVFDQVSMSGLETNENLTFDYFNYKPLVEIHSGKVKIENSNLSTNLTSQVVIHNSLEQYKVALIGNEFHQNYQGSTKYFPNISVNGLRHGSLAGTLNNEVFLAYNSFYNNTFSNVKVDGDDIKISTYNNVFVNRWVLNTESNLTYRSPYRYNYPNIDLIHYPSQESGKEDKICNYEWNPYPEIESQFHTMIIGFAPYSFSTQSSFKSVDSMIQAIDEPRMSISNSCDVYFNSSSSYYNDKHYYLYGAYNIQN